MLIKIISFFVLIAIWVGLAGVHSEVQLMIFMIAAPFLTFLFALWLKLLPSKNAFRTIRAVMYFSWLVKEVVMSSIAVVKIAFRRNLRIQPLLEPVKSIQKNDIGIVSYANSITLTPGTVTLSVEDNVLLVHALDQVFMDDLREGEMDAKIKQVIK